MGRHRAGYQTDEALVSAGDFSALHSEIRRVEMEQGNLCFPFPHKAYDTQQDFMRQMYSILDNGEIGIFESPTGTVCFFHELSYLTV